MGFCTQCRAQGTLKPRQRNGAAAVPLGAVPSGDGARLATGMGELDRTLGGGLVPGASILLGGEPGVGKSTLFLQVAGRMVSEGRKVLLASAEESAAQVALRATRLAGIFDDVDLVTSNDVDQIVSIAGGLAPSLLIVDSIQTISTVSVEGAAGGVGQVRECGARLVAYAKRSGVPVVMIGHVTKEGSLAGPRVLEHTVDVVLYLEGDPHRGVRFVRGLKNRFGATPSLGFFEMSEGGLVELPDPAGALVDHWKGDAVGSVLFPALEGRRPVVVEVQALVAPTKAAQPRRSVKGIEAARLHQVLAVLGRHAGIDVGAMEVYVAVVGGVRIREPAADLAVALAVASSAGNTPLPTVAAWGEVGLTGEVRAVGGDEHRQAEVSRLGVKRVIAPDDGLGRLTDALRKAGLMPLPVGTPF
jgi:DNA repair protein RadA/Sms